MILTLEIWTDGELVSTTPVNPSEIAWRAVLDQNPPPNARGSVAVIVNAALERAGNYATSAHSTHGPRWAIEREPAVYRRTA